VFVPDNRASKLAKHPTLPVLYVTCDREVASRKLLSFRLDRSGAIDPETLRTYDDYFTGNTPDPSLAYDLFRPSILPQENILYLGVSPGKPDAYFAATNRADVAAVSLDAHGEPARRIATFRFCGKGMYRLRNLWCEPSRRRLYLYDYAFTGSYQLGEDGLPLSTKPTTLPCGINKYFWAYIPEWRRFYCMPPGPQLTVLEFASRDELLIGQNASTPIGTPSNGQMRVSKALQSVYILSSAPKKELVIYRLTKQGGLTGLPVTFALGETLAIQVDDQANRLYAFRKNGTLGVYRLNTDGQIDGPSQNFLLPCGKVRDILLDKQTSRLYVACSDPPRNRSK
jgi:hypothetical protein